MNDHASVAKPIAEGVVRGVFSITLQGLTVVVLEEGFTGSFKAPGLIESDRGRASFSSIEIADGYEVVDSAEQAKGWVAVAIPDEIGRAKSLFQKGDRVRIYDGLRVVR